MRRRFAFAAIGVLVAMGIAACADEVCVNFSDRYSGAILFQLHCAGCHGEDARGNGPVAEFLTVKVPDLTQISARRGGQFPDEEIFRIIDGQSEIPAHGARHMPMWGYEFFGRRADDDERAHGEATEKIKSLESFLRKVQRPAS
jgi:hypothetical protein